MTLLVYPCNLLPTSILLYAVSHSYRLFPFGSVPTWLRAVLHQVRFSHLPSQMLFLVHAQPLLLPPVLVVILGKEKVTAMQHPPALPFSFVSVTSVRCSSAHLP